MCIYNVYEPVWHASLWNTHQRVDLLGKWGILHKGVYFTTKQVKVSKQFYWNKDQTVIYHQLMNNYKKYKQVNKQTITKYLDIQEYIDKQTMIPWQWGPQGRLAYCC